MKILSDQEYKALLAKIDEKDNSEAVKPYKEEIQSLKKEIDTLIDNHARKIDQLKEDNKIAIEREKASTDVQIHKATESLKDENLKLTIAKSKAEQEAEILTTAFKNLGFDVKDMKNILDKLVEGLVAKNQIQIIGQK